MKSKISFFNAGLFKSTLRRFWPLWIIHFAGWLLFLPVLTLMNNFGPNRSTDFIFAICESAVFASPIIAFIMAILAAMAGFTASCIAAAAPDLSPLCRFAARQYSARRGSAACS